MISKMFAWLGIVVLFGSALAAQQDIVVQYPVGTTLADGSVVDLGDHPDKAPYNLTIRIVNIGTGTNLVLDTSASDRPCTGAGAVRCIWFINPPATNSLAPAASTDFTMDITPNDNGKWSVWLEVHSDDPDTPVYSILFKGSAGEEDDDDDCSSREGSGLSFLALLGAISLLAIGCRLRSARA